ncbi:MAG: HNH endonuclease [Planctomycetaceae bacterium]|nr:HNH endonuclease [Planctomycetaceae bacterium]
MLKCFKMPAPSTVMSRTSSLRNAYIAAIIPCIKPSDAEVIEALALLGMKPENVVCAYCGDPKTEWDHFFPLVDNLEPTGYITEIYNLVPSCHGCNMSKGNKDWQSWMHNTPRISQSPDFSERVAKLQLFKQWGDKKRNRLQIKDHPLYQKHMKNLEAVFDAMKNSKTTAETLRKDILSLIRSS